MEKTKVDYRFGTKVIKHYNAGSVHRYLSDDENDSESISAYYYDDNHLLHEIDVSSFGGKCSVNKGAVVDEGYGGHKWKYETPKKCSIKEANAELKHFYDKGGYCGHYIKFELKPNGKWEIVDSHIYYLGSDENDLKGYRTYTPRKKAVSKKHTPTIRVDFRKML